jgi:hypothetical protein
MVRASFFEEAFSDGDDACARAPAAAPPPRRRASAAPPLPQRAAAPPPPPGPRRGRGAPPLAALCLGNLAVWLDELVELGDAVLPRLPPDDKAALLAAARRRGVLGDAALRLLINDVTALDLRGATVSEAAVRAALSAAPRLRYVDFSEVYISGETIRALPRACPALEVLRLGGHGAARGAEVAAALRAVLPRVELREAWEIEPREAWDDEPAAAGEHEEPEAAGGARLAALRCVVWPDAPPALSRRLAAAAPGVALNPSDAEVRRRRLPAAALAAAELDSAALARVAGAAAWPAPRPSIADADATECSEPAEPAEPSIAERFLAAYVWQEERDAKRALRQERKAARLARRALRASGTALALHEWEFEV